MPGVLLVLFPSCCLFFFLCHENDEHIFRQHTKLYKIMIFFSRLFISISVVKDPKQKIGLCFGCVMRMVLWPRKARKARRDACVVWSFLSLLCYGWMTHYELCYDYGWKQNECGMPLKEPEVTMMDGALCLFFFISLWLYFFSFCFGLWKYCFMNMIICGFLWFFVEGESQKKANGPCGVGNGSQFMFLCYGLWVIIILWICWNGVNIDIF